MDGSESSQPLVVSLLDYGAGNTRSVVNAIKRLGYAVSTIATAADIEAAAVIVYPGVGSFGNAMDTLNLRGWTQPLKAYLASDRPFFGICLGMQTLFEGSEESPAHAGLGLIPGTVAQFGSTKVSVPHIGWNGVRRHRTSPVLDALSEDDTVYFVHSYR